MSLDKQIRQVKCDDVHDNDFLLISLSHVLIDFIIIFRFFVFTYMIISPN